MTSDSTPSSPCPDDGHRRRLPLSSSPLVPPRDLGELRHAELVRADGLDVLILFFAYVPDHPLADCYSLTLQALELTHN